MGFEEVSSNSGYTDFGKGANLIIKPQKLEHDRGEYKGEEYFQLHFVFDAVPENGGEQGRAPAWLSSKITIKESDEHTSGLGKFLQAAEKLEPVLRDLGASDELIQEIKDGDERYIAKSEDENRELMEALAKNIDGVVLRAGSKLNSNGEYSVVKEFYEIVDNDPFANADDDAESESADEEAADDDDVSEEDIEEASTDAEPEKQVELA